MNTFLKECCYAINFIFRISDEDSFYFKQTGLNLNLDPVYLTNQCYGIFR